MAVHTAPGPDVFTPWNPSHVGTFEKMCRVSALVLSCHHHHQKTCFSIQSNAVTCMFSSFSSYSSPCMLYVYAIYVCILTTTYNVIRVSKTYLAVTNNARWSIRSSNWWENAQVRLELCFIRNHIMKSKKIITWNCSFLYKRLICFPRNIMCENANEWRWMRKDRY